MSTYANDESVDRITEETEELINNPKGKCSTKLTLQAPLSDPRSLREYRRGLQIQLCGVLQSVPIHYPRQISNDLLSISADNLLSRLAFNTTITNVTDIFDHRFIFT